MAGRGAAFAGTLATMREVWRGDVAGARGPIPALPERHRGRALRGLGNREEARERLTVALRFFRDAREAYNTARTLTDLAETSLDSGDPAGALPLIDEAVTALGRCSANRVSNWARGEACGTRRGAVCTKSASGAFLSSPDRGAAPSSTGVPSAAA